MDNLHSLYNTKSYFISSCSLHKEALYFPPASQAELKNQKQTNKKHTHKKTPLARSPCPQRYPSKVALYGFIVNEYLSVHLIPSGLFAVVAKWTEFMTKLPKIFLIRVWYYMAFTKKIDITGVLLWCFFLALCKYRFKNGNL